MVTSGLSVWKPARHAACAFSWELAPPPLTVPESPESEPLSALASLPAPQADRARARAAMPGTSARRMEVRFTSYLLMIVVC